MKAEKKMKPRERDTSGENRVGKPTINSWERHTYAAIYNICATREWMRGIELRTGIVPP